MSTVAQGQAIFGLHAYQAVSSPSMEEGKGGGEGGKESKARRDEGKIEN
jgi:hypothetical protein